MSTQSTMVIISGFAWWAVACNVVDDDSMLDDSGGTGGPSDNQVCIEWIDHMFDEECPPGYAPHAEFDGGTSTVVIVDDPGVGVGLGVGLVVQFGGAAGADWVGYQVKQNSKCKVGCRAPTCPDGQTGCFAVDTASGGLCAYYCNNEEIDQQECDAFAQSCEDTEPGGTGGEDGGLDETGGGDGLDETGDGETTGGVGVMEEAHGCGQWHPETIARPVKGGAFRVPQAIVDQLVLGNADALAECDGVRLRKGSNGRWVISQMHRRGLLGALGLRVGDELWALDGVDLDSIDASVGVLTASFLTEDGNPRQFSPSHPGFSLEVRRGERRFELGLKVVPPVAGGGSLVAGEGR
jgi:hypothetical protein